MMALDLDKGKEMALVLRMKPIHMAAIAGIMFGIGWWVWFDAVAYSKHVESRPRKANDVHVRINMGFWAPGLMATAFLVMYVLPVESLMDRVVGESVGGWWWWEEYGCAGVRECVRVERV